LHQGRGRTPEALEELLELRETLPDGLVGRDRRETEGAPQAVPGSATPACQGWMSARALRVNARQASAQLPGTRAGPYPVRTLASSRISMISGSDRIIRTIATAE